MTTDPLSRAFAALADPTRREIVARLTLGDASISELAAPFAMSLQAISKHVGVLEAAGLVERRGDARRRPVHLRPEALSGLTDWITTHQRRAEERMSRLDDVLTEITGPPRTTRTTRGKSS